MGIDVAWNCAISLRPLSEGEQVSADGQKVFDSIYLSNHYDCGT